MMPQPHYFPFMHGVYDVKAGITSLSRDCGNGKIDGQVFQFDHHADEYRACKRAALENPTQHILRDGLSAATEQTIAQWIAERLCTEHPERFIMESGDALRCVGTDERVPLNCASPLDALAMQVQEDLAVLEVDGQGGNRLSYLHVAMPSGWAPEEKIGRPFDAVHRPVPHIDTIIAKQDQIARLMVNATRGAVRFAWTITTDAALNHHPKRDAPGEDGHGTASLVGHTPGQPLLRVERQVIWGFPKHNASLFTIRTYRYSFNDLDKPTRAALAKAVTGMSEASLQYKSMDCKQILTHLAADEDS